jgi:heavy metal sensor kinase
MRWTPASVRTRLTLWHAGVLTLIICAFSAAIFLFVRARLSHDLELQLARELSTVEHIYREEPGELRDLESHWGITFFQVVDASTVVYQTAAWERGGFADAVPSRRGTTSPRSWTSPDGRHYRVGAVSGPSYQIGVGIDEGPLRQTLRTLAVILLVAIPCATGLALVGGYVLAGRVLVPVGAMADTARKITAESLGERLPVENPDDEFGRLAHVFNDTLSRLHDSFESLRRFTADASHELRTPLTAMRSVGEVALQGPRDAAAYRDVIGSMLEEVDRLTRLVESLLTLTRAESGRIQPTREVVDLGELAANVVDHLRVLAEEKDQHLAVDVRALVRLECDSAILRQGLINLLDNAIKYTPTKGSIEVRVGEIASGEVAVEVKDTGPGIAAPDRDRIFERFYRVDAARSRESGGLGLGLAIARWAVEANGGRIEVESDEGQGSVFRIVFPRES